MKERIIEAIRAVPIAEYQSYAEYVEAVAERLIASGVSVPEANAECEIRNAELRVAREFIETVDEMMECICAMTGVALTYYGRYPEVKMKYTEGQRSEK
jgi:DNA-binding ferritin-like protein